jgi:hypothetical protein
VEVVKLLVEDLEVEVLVQVIMEVVVVVDILVVMEVLWQEVEVHITSLH